MSGDPKEARVAKDFRSGDTPHTVQGFEIPGVKLNSSLFLYTS
jgi:hypothetical protein